MKTYWNRVINKIIQPRNLVYLFIATIFLSVLGNAVNKVLSFIIEDTLKGYIIIFILAFVIFFLFVFIVAKRLELQEKPRIELNKSSPKPHKGLILLVSRLEPCRKAIEHHQKELKKCWLICSISSQQTAQDLQKEFSHLSGIKNSERRIINDVYDPLEFSDCVKTIYQKLPSGWTVEDVITDFTGMTALGSVGTALASVISQSHLQYTPAEYMEGQPTGKSLKPIEIIIKEEK